MKTFSQSYTLSFIPLINYFQLVNSKLIFLASSFFSSAILETSEPHSLTLTNNHLKSLSFTH